MDEKRPLIYSAISSHHFSLIMEKLYFQYKDGRNCDLEIRVEGGRIFAHKCLVDIFFTQAGADIDDDRFVLDMERYDERVVTALLDMMYTGELCIQPHLIKSLQKAAFQLGYSEAEKGCRIYLNSSPRKGSEISETAPTPVTLVKVEPMYTGYENNSSESSDTAPPPVTLVEVEPMDTGYDNSKNKKCSESSDMAPTPVTLVKVEPMDTGYENNSESSSTETAWPGGQEDLERLAREYVENFTSASSSPVLPTTVSDAMELPSSSSVASSTNIYEVVKGKPREHMKLPEGVLQKACEISSGPEASSAVDTSLLLPQKNPFLLVERNKDGTVLLKKEKRINRLAGGTKDAEEVYVYPKAGSKIIDSRRTTNGKTESALNQMRKPLSVAKSKKPGKNVDCSIGTNSSDKTSDSNADDSTEEEGVYLDESSEEEGIYLDNAEEDIVKNPPTRTKSGRTSKRPSLYGEGVVIKRKIGRPRNDAPAPQELEDKMKYELYRHDRRREQFEKRQKVVVDEKQLNNEELKFIPAAGKVPAGCKSRYGRPELMKTKFITETVQKGDGSLAVVTKEVPRRMTWHERQAEKKDAKAPTFVICHPTAPVVRL